MATSKMLSLMGILQMSWCHGSFYVQCVQSASSDHLTHIAERGQGVHRAVAVPGRDSE